jgi:hypothetical protein
VDVLRGYQCQGGLQGDEGRRSLGTLITSKGVGRANSDIEQDV